MSPEELDAIAAGIAERIELATVSHLPGQLIEALQPGQWLNLYSKWGPDRICLRTSVQGDVLELEWEFNGNIIARQRFADRHAE